MTTQLCTIVGSGNEVAIHTADALQQAGLEVVRSFDLSSARAAHGDCSCAHHGTELCDCQMIVLLVYGDAGGPEVLTCHGQDGYTQLVLANQSDHKPRLELETTIVSALLTAFRSYIHLEALS